jgi:hypothetical protein
VGRGRRDRGNPAPTDQAVQNGKGAEKTEESPAFEAKTKLNKQETVELNKFHLFKKGRVLLILFAAVFFVLGVLMFLLAEDISQKVFGAVFTVLFGIGFPYVCWLFARLFLALQFRSAKLISDETENYFKIDAEQLFNRLTKQDCESTFQAKWNLVYKAYETKTHFFIYISNMQAFVISKAGFVAGTAADMSGLLNRMLGKKFIQYIKPQSAPK